MDTSGDILTFTKENLLHELTEDPDIREQDVSMLKERLPQSKLLVVSATGGIGQAVTLIAKHYGAEVLITYHSKNEAAKVLNEEIDGGQPIQYTHGSPEPAERLIDDLPSDLNYVFDASGLPTLTSLNVQVRPDAGMVEKILEAYRTNVLGPLFLYGQLLGSGKLVDGAQIAVSGSIARDGSPGQASYAANKAALAGVMNSLALEEIARAHDIRIKTIEFAMVRTDNRVVKLGIRGIERAARADHTLLPWIKERGYVRNLVPSAVQALAVMVDPSKLYEQRVPEDTNARDLYARVGQR